MRCVAASIAARACNELTIENDTVRHEVPRSVVAIVVGTVVEVPGLPADGPSRLEMAVGGDLIEVGP